MADLEIINHRDTVDRFCGGELSLVPGFNRVPKELVRQATAETSSNPDGFEARFQRGEYEIRKLQVAIPTGKRQAGDG